MSVLVANCPSCGAPVEFKSGQSIVVICTYCRSAVARTDRELKDLGKVAELVETGSPLDVGLRGTWKDVPFELTGRAQLGHEMGGQWDEWYATFSNGWLGWLAEAQGRFYITFQYPIPEGTYVPTFEQLQLGQEIYGLPWPTPLMVAETGRATALGAKGGDARRLLLSRLVIEHRLAPQDPLSLNESPWEQEAMDLLLSDAPVPLSKAAALLS